MLRWDLGGNYETLLEQNAKLNQGYTLGNGNLKSWLCGMNDFSYDYTYISHLSIRAKVVDLGFSHFS